MQIKIKSIDLTRYVYQCLHCKEVLFLGSDIYQLVKLNDLNFYQLHAQFNRQQLIQQQLATSLQPTFPCSYYPINCQCKKVIGNKYISTTYSHIQLKDKILVQENNVIRKCMKGKNNLDLFGTDFKKVEKKIDLRKGKISNEILPQKQLLYNEVLGALQFWEKALVNLQQRAKKEQKFLNFTLELLRINISNLNQNIQID